MKNKVQFGNVVLGSVLLAKEWLSDVLDPKHVARSLFGDLKRH